MALSLPVHPEVLRFLEHLYYLELQRLQSHPVVQLFPEHLVARYYPVGLSNPELPCDLVLLEYLVHLGFLWDPVLQQYLLENQSNLQCR